MSREPETETAPTDLDWDPVEQTEPTRVRIGGAFARGDQTELAAELLRVLRGSAEPIVFDDFALHRYDPGAGLWSTIDDSEASRIVQSFAGRPVQAGKGSDLKIDLKDVRGARALAADQAHLPEFFHSGPSGLAFKNGFVEVTAGGVEAHPHSPKNRARFGYSFDYVGNVAAPMFLKFLYDLFRDDGDREEKICLLQEFFGASLVGIAPRYQRTILAKGTGENGKNALIDVALSAFPPSAVTAIAPQHFSDEYRRALLAGKRLNVVSELPEAEIIASESFKAIVTGDPIDGRHIRSSPFTFRSVAGHFFSANALPGTRDQTHGFWRRFAVVTFNRSFENDPAKDPEIASKIIAAERPAIVSWMLVGAQRLLRSGRYTLPPSHDDALAVWRREADPVACFLDDCAEPAENGTPAAHVYKRYTMWASENGHKAMSSTKFGQRMKGLGKEPSARHGDARMYPIVMR